MLKFENKNRKMIANCVFHYFNLIQMLNVCTFGSNGIYCYTPLKLNIITD